MNGLGLGVTNAPEPVGIRVRLVINKTTERDPIRERNFWALRLLEAVDWPYRQAELEVAYQGVVAVGLLNTSDLQTLGPSFDRAWPVQDTACFSELLRAIDEADRTIRQAQPRHPSE